MKTILTDYNSLNEADFSKRSSTIVEKMTGNRYFTSLSQKTADVARVFADYQRQAAEATNGNKDIIRLKNETRASLTAMMIDLGKDVMSLSTNLTMLESSGFALSKTPESTPPLAKPTFKKVVAGLNDGEILVTGRRQKGVKSFTFYISTDPASGIWQVISTTSCKYLFTGLENRRHYIKYAVVGVKGQMVMSDTITYTPQ